MIWGQRPVRRLHQSASRPFMKGKRSLVTGCLSRVVPGGRHGPGRAMPGGPTADNKRSGAHAYWIAGTSEPDPDQMETSSPGLTASGAVGPAVGGAIWLRWGSPRGPVVSEGRFGGAAWGRGLDSLVEEGPLLWYVGCKTRWGGEVHIYRKEGNTRGRLPAWRPWLIVVVTRHWLKARRGRTK